MTINRMTEDKFTGQKTIASDSRQEEYRQNA